jgi:hypothetical protein
VTCLEACLILVTCLGARVMLTNQGLQFGDVNEMQSILVMLLDQFNIMVMC